MPLSEIPGLVLAFTDGDTSAGTDSLRSALTAGHYGTLDCDFTVYCNVAGTLVKVDRFVKVESTDDDYLYFTHFFTMPDASEPFYSTTIRIDGRA